MSAKHTPGPWTYAAQDGTPGHCFTAQVFGPDGNSIAVIDPTVNADEATATACIMAAAPDLREALEGLLPDTFTGPYDRAREIAHWERERDLGNGNAPLVLAAFAAISKATTIPSIAPNLPEEDGADAAAVMNADQNYE